MTSEVADASHDQLIQEGLLRFQLRLLELEDSLTNFSLSISELSGLNDTSVAEGWEPQGELEKRNLGIGGVGNLFVEPMEMGEDNFSQDWRENESSPLDAPKALAVAMILIMLFALHRHMGNKRRNLLPNGSWSWGRWLTGLSRTAYRSQYRADITREHERNKPYWTFKGEPCAVAFLAHPPTLLSTFAHWLPEVNPKERW
ncbi:unnamed protein product [Choristocarpus tenellus]